MSQVPYRLRYAARPYKLSHLSFLSSFSLSLGDGPIWTEILSQRAVKPRATNQPFSHEMSWMGSGTSLGRFLRVLLPNFE